MPDLPTSRPSDLLTSSAQLLLFLLLFFRELDLLRLLDFFRPLLFLRLLLFLLLLFLLLDFFRGTLAPFARASESPMAMACSRLFTFG